MSEALKNSGPIQTIEEKVLRFYAPPFKYCTARQKIFDSNNHLVLDVYARNTLFSLEGMVEGSKIMDKFGQAVTDIMNAGLEANLLPSS